MNDLATDSLPNRIPVSIVSGYLGSGKTTMINHLVNRPGMENTALIINEFGEIGLDNLLVESAIENTLLLENGCICCSIRGDLIDTICDLFAKAQNNQIPQFSRILIETTGLANPGPIIKSVQDEPAVVNRCRLECVITLVDGVQGLVQTVQHEEAVVQIAQADIVLISKSDLTTPDKMAILEEGLRKINPTLVVKSISHGEVEPDFLFQGAVHRTEIPHTHEHEHDHDHDHDHRHNHDAHIDEFSHGDVSTWSLVQEAPLDEERLRAWLSMLFSLRPFAMLRLKGILRVSDDDRPLLLQAVGRNFSPPAWMADWPGGKPESQLVLIYKGMSTEAISKSFRSYVLQ